MFKIIDIFWRLWIIENIGPDKCKQLFNEMFDISLDPHYQYIQYPELDVSEWQRIYFNYNTIKR
jgi:hypothetical protein